MNVLKVLFELVAYLSLAPLCVLFTLNEVPGSVFVFLFSLLSLGLCPSVVAINGLRGLRDSLAELVDHA